MTFRRLLPAAAALALGLSPALAEPIKEVVDDGSGKDITYIDATKHDFPTERQIVDIVASVLGTGATLSSGNNLPPDVEALIAEGNPAPPTANPRALRPELAVKLDPLAPEGTRWLQAGEHLIAVDDVGIIRYVVYDVLA